MARQVGWYYRRRGSASCRKAQGFLAEQAIRVRQQVESRPNPLGRRAALRLARQAEKIVVARGRKVISFDMRTAPPDEDTLLKHLLGPGGNLRAPTILTGKTLLVGFNPEVYRAAFR